ncbi:MAG: hypothetical protein Q9227_008018 [Pyrenula ochraceoflavens]
MDPLKKKFLPRLQKMTFDEQNSSKCFAIFLSTFILLQNIERCVKHNRNYALRHKLPGIFGNSMLVKSLALGADTVLFYFHMYRQKTATLNWDTGEISKTLELSPGQRQLFNNIAEFVQTRKYDFETIKEKKEQWGEDLSFASQMFDSKCRPFSDELLND